MRALDHGCVFTWLLFFSLIVLCNSLHVANVYVRVELWTVPFVSNRYFRVRELLLANIEVHIDRDSEFAIAHDHCVNGTTK
jgi:hypothetical protein